MSQLLVTGVTLQPGVTQLAQTLVKGPPPSGQGPSLEAGCAASNLLPLLQLVMAVAEEGGAGDAQGLASAAEGRGLGGSVGTASLVSALGEGEGTEEDSACFTAEQPGVGGKGVSAGFSGGQAVGGCSMHSRLGRLRAVLAAPWLPAVAAQYATTVLEEAAPLVSQTESV